MRRAPSAPGPLSRIARVAAEPPSSDLLELRRFLRSGGFAAFEALSVALFIYCLVFQRKMVRRAI